MYVGNCTSKFISLDNGLSLFLQERDDGGVEYDVFQMKCEPIDGGILDDESLEDGIAIDASFLKSLLGNRLFKGFFGRLEDHIVFTLEDSAADAVRGWVSDFGADEGTLTKLYRKIRSYDDAVDPAV